MRRPTLHLRQPGIPSRHVTGGLEQGRIRSRRTPLTRRPTHSSVPPPALPRFLKPARRRVEPPADTTDLLPVVDDALSVRILDLAVRMGETMLVAGAPASEVALTIVRVCEVYGLTPVHVDVTYNSITAAYSRSGAARPVTLLRVVRGSTPDHDRLMRLQALVADISAGMGAG